MASLDEAQKCPKCGLTGNVRNERMFPDRTKLLNIYCENDRCSWYNTSWNVSVRSDGSIPDPQIHKGPKTYVGFEHDDLVAKRLIADLIDLNDASLKGKDV